MRWLAVAVAIVAGVALSARSAMALDRDEVMRLLGEELGKKVLAAVKKGCEYLKSQQKSDGHWEGKHLSTLYPDGVTALALYALLKGGTPKNDEAIKKGFAWLRQRIAKNGFKTVYSTSCIILALSALMEPPPIKKEREKLLKNPTMRTRAFEPEDKRKRAAVRKAPKWAREMLRRAVAWLLKQQQKYIWRYPGAMPGGVGGPGPDHDCSNTQYAALALHEAMRCGISVPADVFKRVAQYFVTYQEPSGPEVKSFRVPGADLSLKGLKKLEKKILKAMEEEWKAQLKEWKRAKEGEKPQLRLPKTSAIEVGNPYKRLKGEMQKMHARGWSYIEHIRGMRLPDGWLKTTGSMTTSGVICLTIAKSVIEGKVPKHFLKKINQAIRDGMAWLAHHWTTTRNPNSDCWHLYYLYGVERCGVLTLTEKLGEHKWYKEGAEYLISAQQPNGSWKEEVTQGRFQIGNASGHIGLGPVENTCFAILFLGRATTPIIGEKTVKTGLGMFGK
ncbi:MAG: hypothetical protein DRP82_05850 [Planctomycetota bacterium]|nr:MAG: hypothetical protein DRP82_05850 [Planctomycetota bacterium]